MSPSTCDRLLDFSPRSLRRNRTVGPLRFLAQSQLAWNHTVITFNFYAVPEILQTSEGRLSVVDPKNVKTSIKAAHDEDKAPVLKLHGSLTWSTNVGGGGFEMTCQPETALEYLGTREVVIGLPGPKKRGLYADTLKDLREAAVNALQVAGQVIFVGYRFPPTDADARRFLLGAIRNNRTDGDHILSAWVVLGPDTESPDVKRLRHLLETVLGKQVDVYVLPLLAENFLSVREIMKPRPLPPHA